MVVSQRARSLLSAPLAVTLLLSAQSGAPAAPGDLDPTFGHDGRVLTGFESASAQDLASDVAVQSDGKIMAVGGTFLGGFALARYEADGSLDPAFGGDGRVRTSWPGLGQGFAAAVALQPDGKIVAAGSTFDDSYTSERFAVARYMADGGLDGSFGGDGRVSTAFALPRSSASSVAIQADGSIVVAGSTNTREFTKRRFALARYDADGRLDPTFGDRGRVMTAFGAPSSAASGVAIQSDGRLVAAGTVTNRAGSGDRIAVARYVSDGTLDRSFGREGRVKTAFPTGSVNGSGLALQGDGVIVAGTASTDEPMRSRFALARYHTRGNLDRTFGGDGRVTTPFRSASAADVVIESDGRIVVAGTACCKKEFGSRFALARYDRDGGLDLGFDEDGKVRTAFRFGSAGASGIAIQADGRIVACGSASFGHGILFALSRYVTS
jgi:uncharacterized delta-60 repeat protein